MASRFLPRLRVSRATARFLRGGHPWVLPDRQTGSTRGLRPGQLVDLVGPDGAPLGRALADPGARVVARRVADAGEDFDPLARALTALERRRELLDANDSDALRLLHGEADGLPGLHVDRLGTALVSVRRAACADAFTDAVVPALLQALDLDEWWDKTHHDDLRRGQVTGRARRGALVEDDERVVVEDGLRYHVRPFAGLATGIYPDQRENRRRLRQAGPFRNALNLFAYTGAFSVSVARDGAEQVTDADTSASSLRIARRNHTLNGLDPSCHHTSRADARSYLEGRSSADFDLIVIDPPTASRGSRGWSARRGYDTLLDAALRRLLPGGTLLACLNDRSARSGHIDTLVRDAAGRAGRRLHHLRPAGPAPDFPVLAPFPEGTMFQGVLAVVG